jgi:hypothetical protein
MRSASGLVLVLIAIAMATLDVPLKTDTDRVPPYTSHAETPLGEVLRAPEPSSEPVPVVVTMVESRAGPAVPPEPRSVPKDRVAMGRQLQTELKRVGCYVGDLHGVWTRESREAMSAFIDRANATLPVDEPDGILLTLVRTYDGKVCGERCPAGQGLSHTGGCVPHAILAAANEAKSVPSAAASPANRATPAIIGWTTSVAGAALIAPTEPLATETPADPLSPAVVAPTPKIAQAGAADKRRSQYAERGGGWARNVFRQLDRLGAY